MTHEEYEERKRRLDKQLRAGVELLEAAHRQQVRALDLVWMSIADEAVPLGEAPSRPEAQAPAPAQAPAAPPPRARRTGWQLREDVEAALTRLPELFDRNDLCHALGYEPDRAALYRTVWDLISTGVLALADRGSGRTPSRYRKTGAVNSQADA